MIITSQQKKLHKAVRLGDLETATKILASGTSPDFLFESKRGYVATTPLMEASSQGNLSLVQLLSTTSAIDMENIHGATALYYAISSKVSLVSPDIVELLLNVGANPNITPSGMCVGTIFCASIAKGRLALVRTFLKYGASIQVPPPVIRFPLGEAGSVGDVDIIKELLSRGAFVNSQDQTGGTALLFASSAGHIGAVELLLQYGADPNIPGSRGETPIIAASDQIGSSAFENTSRVYLAIIRDLLQAGANPNVVAKNGWTPLDFVEYWPRYHNQEVLPEWISAAVGLLREKGAMRRCELS